LRGVSANSSRFTEWAKQYGGIFSLKLGHGTAIVLTDRRLVRELLDKRSSIYSDRATSFLAQKLITGGDHLLTMNYGPDWRKLRKLLHQDLTESLCDKHHIKLVNAEAVQMLRDFVNNPSDHMLHPKRYSNSIVMSLCKSKQVHSM
jgi:cytochrome P450